MTISYNFIIILLLF